MLANHWTVFRRLATYPWDTPVTSVGWYTPVEPIPGAFEQSLPTVAPATVGLDPEALAAAGRYADAKNSSAFLVLRRGRIAFEKYWRGADARTATNSFSMAKTFLVLLFGIAMARNEVDSFDDGVERYVDEWRGQPRGRITLRQLFSMESGLLYENDRSNPFSDMVQVHLASDLLPVILAMQPGRSPGTTYEYNNLNTQLLGLVLERATKQRYARMLSERLWQPVGAQDASVWLDRRGGNAKLYGCVFARARDYARIGELVRNRGRVGARQVVPSRLFETIERPSRNPVYGLHIWLSGNQQPRDIPDYVFLDGKSKQRVFVLRSLEMVVVRVGENTRGWSDHDLLQLVVRGAR